MLILVLYVDYVTVAIDNFASGVTWSWCW